MCVFQFEKPGRREKFDYPDMTLEAGSDKLGCCVKRMLIFIVSHKPWPAHLCDNILSCCILLRNTHSIFLY